MTLNKSPRGKHPASSIGLIVLLFSYLFLMGVAIALLSPLIAFVIGLLPLLVLFFNQTFRFKAPLKLLHGLFVAAITLSVIWPRYIAFNFGGPDLTPSRLMYAILLFIWFGTLTSPDFRKDVLNLLLRQRLWVSLTLAYFLLRLLTCFFSDEALFSFYHVANELVTAGLILPIVISIYRDPRRLESLLFWIFLAGIVIACLAIIERIVSHGLFSNVTFPGMKTASVFSQNVATMDKLRDGVYRAQSTFGHPILLAEFMMFEIPLALYFSTLKSRFRFVGILGVLLFIIAAYVSGSRSSFVAIPVMLVMAVILLSLRSKGQVKLSNGAFLALMALAVGGLCTFTLLVFGVIDFGAITGKSTSEVASTKIRLLMLTQGMSLIADRPFVGYGPGLSGYVLGFANAAGTITIDNYYLSLALDSGIIVVLVFVILTFGVAAKGFWTSITKPSQNNLMKGFIGISMIGMLIVKLILSIPENLPILIFCLALILAPAESCVSQDEEKNE